ncbi:MAG: antitoxin [Rhodocyclales bacterium GWA2_65_19]|nr:MAG: antitoxin [Rhodocyclales bacterium GWA2_65_19]
MNWKDHVIVDPKVLVGKPIIRGTRISVELLMDRLADGWSMEQILESYPRVTRDDVLAAIAFVTEVFREEDYIAIQKATA